MAQTNQSIYALARVIGDDADNTIRLSDDDFTFINGGDGYDTIILDSATTNFTHNLSGDAYKDEMSSIENINFADGDDTLKITLDNLIRLVKTSNNNVDGKAEIVISTDGTGSNLNGLSTTVQSRLRQQYQTQADYKKLFRFCNKNTIPIIRGWCFLKINHTIHHNFVIGF